jgi:hypothetical protein
MATKPAEGLELQPTRLPPIPDPPKRGAVRSLQRALLSHARAEGGALGLSEEAAEAIAYAVPDPAATRTYALKRPSYIRVPGGTFTVIRDEVFVPQLITYPLNPRVLESERFPAAEGEAAVGRLFWPETDLASDPNGACQLVLRAGTRLRASRVLQEHATRLRRRNPLESIAAVGVLRPIVVMPMTVRTDEEEGQSPRTVLTSVEGSSRTAWSHHYQELDAADALYGAVADPAVVHALARTLREVRDAPADEVTDRDVLRARTLLIQAEIVISFSPDEGSTGSLPAAVDQLLGGTHIDPPLQWADKAIDETIGEKILATLHERDLIDVDEQAWLAGMLTPGEAESKGFSSWSAWRAAKLLWLMSRDPQSEVGKAVAAGVRRASFQRVARRELKATVVAALALRALDETSVDNHKPIRAALPRALRMAGFWATSRGVSGRWKVTERHPDELRDLALEELRDSGPGPATLELAALGGYALVTTGKLKRGTAKSRADGDPRDPETILAEMIQTPLGVRVLHRAAVDHLDGEEPRRFNQRGYRPQTTADGGWVRMSERWLRHELFPRQEPGEQNDAAAKDAAKKNAKGTVTPKRRFDLKLIQLDRHIATTGTVLDELEAIPDDDGKPIILREGIDEERVERLNQEMLNTVSRIHRHGDTFRARYGSAADTEDEPDDLETDEELEEA